MNLLGRIFVGLILVASIGFFFAALFANSTHMDYKEKLTDLRAKNEALTRTVNQAKADNEKLQTSLLQEQVARTATLAALQQQLSDQNEELQQANKKLSDLNSVNTIKTQKLSETLDRLKASQSLNDTLRIESDKVITDRNQQRKNVIKLTDELNSLKSMETDLREQLNEVRDRATRSQALADTRGNALKNAGINDVEDAPPADVHGQVLAVTGNTLEISLGRDDGIRSGHNLEVFRGAKYIGRVQIERTLEDKSVGRVLPSYRKGFIQAGDQVASKILE
jgi:multidrug efflux pump subunit AcrA (membrane-fusion protein)